MSFISFLNTFLTCSVGSFMCPIRHTFFIYIIHLHPSSAFSISEACHAPHFFFFLNIFTTFITVDAILKAVKA